MRTLRWPLPAVLLVVASCSGTPDRDTLASLHAVKPDVADVEVQDTLDLALQSYRRFLDETPTSAMTPEAMRRLADLQIEREFGITGGDAAKRRAPMPAPSAAAAPLAPLSTPKAWFPYCDWMRLICSATRRIAPS